MTPKKIQIKKPRYIRKYDFLHSLNRPKYFWFLPDDTIIKLFHDYNNDEEDDDDDIDYEFDAVDYLRESQLEDVDTTVLERTNAKLLEGKIIDQKAKAFITNHYINQKESTTNMKIYDFDVIFKNNYSLEKQFKFFKETLKKHENAIFFQPTFISEKMGIVAKPDALIYHDGEWDLVEVKGTTTSKKLHLLDMLFQKNTIFRSDVHLNITNYYLCVVAYERAQKNDVTFILTPYFLPKKSYCDTGDIRKKIVEFGKLSEQVIEAKQKEKIGNTKKPITFKNFLEPTNSNNDLENKMFIEWANFYYNAIYNRFDEIIKEMHHYLDSISDEIEIKILPSWEYHSFFKDFEYAQQLKKFFAKNGYIQFDYSALVICWAYAMVIYEFDLDVETTINILATDKKYLNHYLDQVLAKKPLTYIGRATFAELGRFYNKCIQSKDPVYIDEAKARNLLNTLKKKKVYFDFETISMAVRPIDNILPFTQIVTQCSILKGINSQTKNPCLNLVVDPKSITMDFFKEVIDSLYWGEDASYIVYNKGFEKTRLEELIGYLDDDEYTHKILTIINNLYDLADFFQLSKQVICIKSIHGNHSIKKILPFILNDPKIVAKTKVIDYETLNVKKGDQCQGITAQRFYNLIDDAEWEKVKKELQIYCENDVRVMVAIYEFIRGLLRKSKY